MSDLGWGWIGAFLIMLTLTFSCAYCHKVSTEACVEVMLDNPEVSKCHIYDVSEMLTEIGDKKDE